MKETIIKSVSKHALEASGVVNNQAQPCNRKEQILDNLTDKEQKIKELELKISELKNTVTLLENKGRDLEAQNNDLDYLLNSGRNEFENQRNKRLRELEAKLNQPLTNRELLFNLVRKWEIGELKFVFKDEDNKLFLEDKKSKERIYLFTLKIEDNDIAIFYPTNPPPYRGGI